MYAGASAFHSGIDIGVDNSMIVVCSIPSGVVVQIDEECSLAMMLVEEMEKNGLPLSVVSNIVVPTLKGSCGRKLVWTIGSTFPPRNMLLSRVEVKLLCICTARRAATSTGKLDGDICACRRRPQCSG